MANSFILLANLKAGHCSNTAETQRRDVFPCACVSKKWREITQDNSGKITFPSCSEMPGLRDFSNQCLIKRNKRHQLFS
uniref:F-box domain-containing protein n=1 Tax=Brassica oleracea TaxID=3712 RepID=A0A3P6DTT9_BRAOL|nr:unnamed protein product [Brassica oleracea]